MNAYDRVLNEAAARQQSAVQLAAARARQADAQAELRRVSMALESARNAAEGMDSTGRFEPDHNGVSVAYDRPLVPRQDRSRARVAELEADREAAADRAQELSEQVAALEQTARAPLAASLEDIRHHEAATAAARATVERLEAARNAAEGALDTDPWADPRPALERERGDILAGIALGEVAPEALAEHDKAHSKILASAEREASKRATAEAEARGALDGLTRRLEQAQAELSRLEELGPIVLAGYLAGECAAADEAFSKAARAYSSAHARIVGLRVLLQRAGGRAPQAPPPAPAPKPDEAARDVRAELAAVGVAV